MPRKRERMKKEHQHHHLPPGIHVRVRGAGAIAVRRRLLGLLRLPVRVSGSAVGVRLRRHLLLLGSRVVGVGLSHAAAVVWLPHL